MKRMAKKAMALTLAMCLTCTAVPTMANQNLKVTKEEKAVKSSRNYVEGQAIELSKDDVLIEMTQKEGFVASSDKGITVVLDTNLTPELIEEGFVREVISKVQTMRKDAGFEVMDKINLYVSGNDKIADIVNKNAAQVKTVVLAQDIITGKTAGFEKEWDINGEKVTLAVEKLA